MSFPWSRVQNAPLARAARNVIYDSPYDLRYHDWEHIVSLKLDDIAKEITRTTK